MKHKYLIPVCVSALALCVMVGCDNNAKPTANTETQPELLVDDNVDWNTPLYVLGESGDTLQKYEYNAVGQLIADYDYYENEVYTMNTYEYDDNGNMVTTTPHYKGEPLGIETRKYDEQNRLIKYEYEVESDSGVSEYTYEGNKRIEESEEALSECVYQDVTETYYDENGNDTLIVRSSALVRDHTDGDYDYNAEPVIYRTRKTYVTVNGEQKLKSSVMNEEKKDGSVVLRGQEDYEYDQLGRVVSYIHYELFSHDCDPNQDTIIYTYSDNCMTDQNGVKTYYKRK